VSRFALANRIFGDVGHDSPQHHGDAVILGLTNTLGSSTATLRWRSFGITKIKASGLVVNKITAPPRGLTISGAVHATIRLAAV
jgi:hypothetical protein